MGHSNNKTSQMVPALSSGSDFVVTLYFDFGALSLLRDAFRFLLQEGEVCPGPTPRREDYVAVYSVSTRIKLLASEASFYVVCICRCLIPFSLRFRGIPVFLPSWIILLIF